MQVARFLLSFWDRVVVERRLTRADDPGARHVPVAHRPAPDSCSLTDPGRGARHSGLA
jgi:hypothetical protein